MNAIFTFLKTYRLLIILLLLAIIVILLRRNWSRIFSKNPDISKPSDMTTLSNQQKESLEKLASAIRDDLSGFLYTPVANIKKILSLDDKSIKYLTTFYTIEYGQKLYDDIEEEYFAFDSDKKTQKQVLLKIKNM